MSSRLIVKNLPDNLSEEKLRAHFGEKGHITDCQLKYTKDGKFRHFAFIGFQTPESAKSAVDYFNQSFLKSRKITVEFCSKLGDENKPRAWSKYAPDSSSHKKLLELKKKKDEQKEATSPVDENKKKNKKNKNKDIDPDIQNKLDKYKDDPMFTEFLEIHGKDKSVWKNDAPLLNENEADKDTKIEGTEDSGIDHEGDSNDESSDESEKLASADISDKDYLKLKTLKNTEDAKELLTKAKKTKAEKSQKYDKLFTIKLTNLPFKARKRDVKAFLKPFKVDSIRVPQKIHGIAFVGFKSEETFKKVLKAKNKSFLNGKQILLHEYVKIEPKESNSEEDRQSRWKAQADALKSEEDIGESGRIFIRNLSYAVTEDDLQNLFSKYGDLTEVIVPIDRLTRKSKGFAIITFLFPENAVKAYSELDGSDFQGRMLHILPSKAIKTPEELPDTEGSFKAKKQSKLKKEAGSAHNWNTLFLGANAVADVIAETYNASKEDILAGSGAAVRLALGETQLVTETREFLEQNDVKLDAFNDPGAKRSKTVILVKNLPAKTTVAELRELFGKFGVLSRVLLPLSGVTAIVEFVEPVEARDAFRKLAYRKFKYSPLYLEWAPENTFTTPCKAPKQGTVQSEDKEKTMNEEKLAAIKIKDEVIEDNDDLEPEPDTTLFIKNLNFNTNEEEIKDHFKNCGKIAKVTVARKKDPSKPGALLSMGYGFIQFYQQAALNEALKTLQLSSLDGHQIELKKSNRTLQTEAHVSRKLTNTKKQTGTKILVRNIPFQAKESEIKELFKTFGEIKSLRIPKKMVGTGSHRGFGFVEFYTKHDAKRAMESFCQSTHLYGRRLVLEWAESSEDVELLRKRTAQQFGTGEGPRNKNFRKGVSYIDPESRPGDEEEDFESETAVIM
ncbi:unnamed protein product [Bemisia tabaci]|uniref:RRM domain-containing protein n=1 Tax=Bemisia tabaci TaxID=7038 RepID=A0A9P0ADW1_BEMTA|nr:unnamed protein product [Bemisia tabaci]